MAAKAWQPGFRDALLAKVCARNSPIEVTVPGRQLVAPLKSRFLGGPDETSATILIEVPTQGGRQVLFLPRDVIDVIVNVEGQRYGFRAFVEKRTRVRLGGRNDVAALALGCPSSVARLQRRRYYRVRIPSAQPIVVKCAAKPPAGKTGERDEQGFVRFETRAIDISAGGMCLKIGKGQSCFARTGTRMVLFFRIDGSRTCRFIGEVRHVRPLPGGECAAGVQFVSADKTVAQRRTVDSIARYVAHRQREELKKASGLE
jgi:c-di-GMP-binding flagellar brake protein YcgR